MTELFNASAYLVDRHVEAGGGDRIALRVRGRSIGYGELLEQVCGAAAGLRGLGVRAEERVLLALLDGAEFVAAFLGAMRLGAIPVPVNPLLPGRDLGLVAAKSRVRVAVVASERAAALADLVEGAPELADVGRAGDRPADGRVGARLHRWDELARGAADVPPHPTWADSPGFWLCTSGTTGLPKLAMHRHADLRTTAEGFAQEVLGITPSDRCYSVAPLFHAYGLGNSLGFPLSVGAAAVLEPTRPPSPSLVAEIVLTEQPTLFFSIPTAYAHLLAAELPPDTFASVRQAVSAGEALPAELFTRFLERFGVEILDGIGSTELTHMFIANHRGCARPGTSGTPVGGYRVRLEDDDGGEVPPETPGHLWVSGDTAATGYWCETDATRRTFRGEWVRTGDVYARSEDGYYTYLGRSDDMLKVGGEWVSPAEVEAVLIEHPDVLEAAVIGEPRPDGLVQPVAYVVAAPDRMLDPDALVEYCRGRLAGYKRPRRVVVLDELPKTATGKIRRAGLRERAPADGPA